jgi:hypothetical protein
MPAKIYQYTAGVRVNRTEQSAECIVQTNDKNGGTERLQVLRHKSHPQLFARANDKNGDEQDDEIAFESKEIRDLPLLVYALLIGVCILRKARRKQRIRVRQYHGR